MPQGVGPIIAQSIGSALASSVIQSIFHKDPVVYAKSTVRATVNDAQVIFGRFRTGGQIMFAKVEGDDIHLAYALSEGSLDSILDFSIDDVAQGDYYNEDTGLTDHFQLEVLEDTAPRLLAPNPSSDHSGSIEVREYFAADGTQGDELQAIFPEDFTDTDKKSYLSWVYVKCIQSAGTRKVWSKPPQMSFLVRGIKFTVPGDPVPKFRKDTASTEWFFLNSMREIPESAHNLPSVMAAVALSSADTPPVSLPPGYEDYNPVSVRYLSDCALSYGDNVAEIQRNLDIAWNGHIVDDGGNIVFRPGAGSNLYPVSKTITVDDILERGTAEFGLQLKDTFNAIRMSLAQSSAKHWEEQDLPILYDREIRAISNQERIMDMGTMRYLSNPVAAVRLMAANLRRIRSGATFPYTLRAGDEMENITILPGDRFHIADPENGLNPDLEGATPFKLMRAVIHPDWRVETELREDPDTIYQDDPELPPLVPRALDPGISDDPPPAPVGVIVDGSHFERTDDGSTIGVFVVSWEHKGFSTILQLTSPTNVVLPQILAYGDTASLPVDRSGRYKLDIYHENSYGVRGPKYLVDGEDYYVSTTFSNAPPVPIITSVSWNGRYVRFTLLTHAQRDVVAADVRYVRADLGTSDVLTDFTEDNWDTRLQLDEPFIAPGAGLRSILLIAGPLPTEGRYRFGIRLLNRAGQQSGIANDPRTFDIHLTIVPAQEIVFGGDMNGWIIDPTGDDSRGVEQVPRPSVDALEVDEARQNVPAVPVAAVLVPDHTLDATTTEGRLDGRSGWLVGDRTDNAIWISAALPLVYYYGAKLNDFSTFGLDGKAEITTPTGEAIPVSSDGLDVLIAFSASSTAIDFDAEAADRMLGGGTAPSNVVYQRLIVDGVASHQTQQGRFSHFRMALRMKTGFQGAGIHSITLEIDGQI